MATALVATIRATAIELPCRPSRAERCCSKDPRLWMLRLIGCSRGVLHAGPGSRLARRYTSAGGRRLMSKSGPLALAAPSWFGCASGGLSYLGTRTSWERGDKETGAGQRPQTADGRGREHDGRGTERPGGGHGHTHPPRGQARGRGGPGVRRGVGVQIAESGAVPTPSDGGRERRSGAPPTS